MRLRPRARPILSTSAASAAHLPVVYSALPAVLTRSALSLSRVCSRAVLVLLVLMLLVGILSVAVLIAWIYSAVRAAA